ncbi:MAG: hypothetical protein JWM99_5097 [Verrucomicrobiales bacterium]|nr:hypothetical protein [Verrucomicrobiales bacterium]
MRNIALVAVAICLASGMQSVAADKLLSSPLLPREERLSGSLNLQIARDGDRATLTFPDGLESADLVTGPWTMVSNAASPLSVDFRNNSKFYRSLETAQTGSVFSSREIVSWTLTGPFQKHFDLAYAGTPDGIFPPHRETTYFDATVKMGTFQLPATVRVRGNSSLQECPFPKLKLKVSKENRVGTPFSDAREIKIGTHCAEGGRGNIGRLRDERAAYRETLAYETMGLLGFMTPRVRRAQIQYNDTTLTNESPIVGWQVLRNGMILEDIEVLAERLGGSALSDVEVSALKDANFGEQLIDDLQLFHLLLGNWDYELSVDGQGLWNTDVIRLADGKLVPLAGDFDLASWVTEEVRLSAPRDYRPDLGEVERQAQYEMEQFRSRAAAENFLTSSNRFAAKRPAIELLVKNASIDEAGRTNALRHLAAFFDALTSAKPPKP